MFDFSEVKNYDPELAEAMENELTRQRTNLELIASENPCFQSCYGCNGKSFNK